QSSDYLPLAGAMVDDEGTQTTGRWLNLAHGSRGITGTPLCADWVADRISRLPVPIDRETQHALEPVRFIQLKRKREKRRTFNSPER
ncbi:MAG: amino acid oxidase, partial [Pseudomonadota bacterium]